MKTKLSERDICTKYITPAIDKSGWNNTPHHFREEVYFTAGRIKVRGKLVKRVKGKRADCLLYYKPNLPIAIIEAKDNTHSPCAGMQQALDYAEILDISFAYSSNGNGFILFWGDSRIILALVFESHLRYFIIPPFLSKYYMVKYS